jgi:tetratricopeptide (TPR) repeat protein
MGRLPIALGWAVALWAAALPALADDAADCRDRDLSPVTRIEACTAALAGRPDRSTEADPLTERAAALGLEDRWAEALVDLRRLLVLEPNRAWAHYWEGRALDALDLPDRAMAAFDRAIALAPEDPFAPWHRGFLHEEAGDTDAARADWDRVRALRPFWPEPYRQLGHLAWDADNSERAAGLYAQSLLLDPDQPVLRAQLARLVPSAPPDLRPAEYAPPPDRALPYLQTLFAPQADGLSADTGPDGPLLAAAFVRRQAVTDGDRVRFEIAPAAGFEMDRLFPDPARRARVDTWRGLLVPEIAPAGPQGPRIRTDLGFDPATLWPLTTGTTLSGTADVVMTCPSARMLTAVSVGCIAPGTEMSLGQLDVTLSVEGTETLRVPRGTFDTFRVRYTEAGTLGIGSLTEPHRREVIWWIAPALGTWVRRVTSDADGVTVLSLLADDAF